jgi:hypothetical protein
MLDVQGHGARVKCRATEQEGTSLRGSGVITKTCSVSARPAGGRGRQKSAGWMLDSFSRLEGYMAVMRDTQVGCCTHRKREALKVMCRGNDDGVGGRPYI